MFIYWKITGVIYTRPMANPTVNTPNAIKVLLNEGKLSQRMPMMLLYRPVADPIPRDISIRKKSTANTCNITSN